jgi:ubiquinone/menaquinone biosynthesis C-methylase UbiE
MSVEPRVVKSQQRKLWDQIAPAWRKWAPVFETGARPVTDLLLEQAKVSEGQWIVDLCAGAGETSLAAADKVGSSGKVVGVDLSKKMIALAEAEAKKAGKSQIGFQEQDVEDLGKWPEGGYEAGICRFGLMYLPQLEVGLRGIHRILTKGARFAAAVWGAPERSPLYAAAESAAEEFLGKVSPSPFSLSEPGVLEQALSSAGFKAIEGERVTMVFELPSLDAAVEMMRETSHLALKSAEVPAERQAEAWAAVRTALETYVEPDGKVALRADAQCVVART